MRLQVSFIIIVAYPVSKTFVTVKCFVIFFSYRIYLISFLVERVNALNKEKLSNADRSCLVFTIVASLVLPLPVLHWITFADGEGHDQAAQKGQSGSGSILYAT